MYKELTFLKQIGEGSFGRVYMARWRETTVAVKVWLMPIITRPWDQSGLAPLFAVHLRSARICMLIWCGQVASCDMLLLAARRCCIGRAAIIWTMMTCRWTPAPRPDPQTPS